MMKPYRSLSFPLALALFAVPSAAQTFQEPPLAVDLDPDPNVVEIQLTAAETTWQYVDGVDTTVWAYNGSVPGPTIRAKVGDTIRVHLQNDLPEATTIHWHGVLTPANVDGAHIAQNPVLPGESFTYEWTALNAGVHWYHPHVRPFDQLEKGLYGAIVIEDPLVDGSLGLHVLDDHIVFFDDVLLDANSQVVPAFSFTDPLENAVYQLNGREGNLLLFNGKSASEVQVEVENGKPQRWRIINAANTTFCRLDLRDADAGLQQDIWQIASDGSLNTDSFKLVDVSSTGPGAEHPGQALLSQMGQGVFLMPGERMDIVFTPIGTDGEVFNIRHHDWFRGRHTASYDSTGAIQLGSDPLDGYYPDQQYLSLKLVGSDPGRGEFVPPAHLRTFPSFSGVTPKGTLQMTMGHSPPDANGDVNFFVQGEKDAMGNFVPLPAKKMTSLKAYDVQSDEVWIWEVTNLTHGEHPFHTHGFPFELLEYEFQDDLDPTNPNLNFTFAPTKRRMLKDTIRIPPRLGAKGSSRTIARLRVAFEDFGREGQIEAMGEQPTFRPDGSWTSGGWLVHCHILEHSGRGMLSFYEIKNRDNPFSLLGRFLPGQLGNPSLTASGDVSLDENVTLEIVNAEPNSKVLLVAGNVAANYALIGGTVVPGYASNGVSHEPGDPAYGLVLSAMSDANGRATFVIDQWQAAPTGFEMFWQAGFRSPGTPNGWALTNALSFVRP